eukprot:scaffold96246_cov20-Tisochrysis_lutea.AAC.2
MRKEYTTLQAYALLGVKDHACRRSLHLSFADLLLIVSLCLGTAQGGMLRPYSVRRNVLKLWKLMKGKQEKQEKSTLAFWLHALRKGPEPPPSGPQQKSQATFEAQTSDYKPQTQA